MLLCLLLFALSSIIKAEITCNASNCIIDCSKTNTVCSNTIVNATGASNATIMCSENGKCSNSEIYCSTSICNIICRGQSCSNRMIYATHTQNVNIDCIDGDYACSTNKIYAENAGSVVYNALSYISHGPYERIELHVENATNVTILCSVSSACENMAIFANYTDAVALIVSAKNGWLFSTLNAISAGSVSISCISETTTVYGEGFCGEGSGACGCVNRYLLSKDGGNTQINCYGFGCSKLGNIFVTESVSNLDVVVHGCGKCMNTQECVFGADNSDINIFCNYSWDNSTYFIEQGTYSTAQWDHNGCDLSDCGCDTLNTQATFVEGLGNECIDNGITQEPTHFPTTVSPTGVPTPPTTTMQSIPSVPNSKSATTPFVVFLVNMLLISSIFCNL